NNAGRNVELGGGSMLLRVPKDSGGARMKTDAVTVGITGTTVILEAARSGRNKLVVLEGGTRLSLNKHPSESAYVRAGQMLDVPAGATKLPSPVDIDLDQIMKTSPLITDFPPLPSQGLISAATQRPRLQVYPGLPIYNPPGGVFTPGRPGKPGGTRPNPTRPGVGQPNASRPITTKPKPSPTPSQRRKPSKDQPN